MANCEDASTIASAVSSLITANGVGHIVDATTTSRWTSLVSAVNDLQNRVVTISVYYPIVVKYKEIKMDSSNVSIYQITKLGKSTGDDIGLPQCYFNVQEASQQTLKSLAQYIKAIDDTNKAVGALACFPQCPSCKATPLAQADNNGEYLWNYNFDRSTCQKLEGSDTCSPKNKIFIPLSEYQLEGDTSFALEAGQNPDSMWIPNPVFFGKLDAIFIPRDFSSNTNPSSQNFCAVDHDNLDSDDVSSTGLTPEEREWTSISGGKYRYIMYSYAYTATFRLRGAVAFGCYQNQDHKHAPIRQDILNSKDNVTAYELLEDAQQLEDMSYVEIVPPKFQDIFSICSSLDEDDSLLYQVKDPVIYAGQFAKPYSNNSSIFRSYVDSVESVLKNENSHSVQTPGIAFLRRGVLLSEASYSTQDQHSIGRVCEIDCQSFYAECDIYCNSTSSYDPQLCKECMNNAEISCREACDCDTDPQHCGDIELPSSCLNSLFAIRSNYDMFSQHRIYAYESNYLRTFNGSWSIADYYEDSWDSRGGVLEIVDLSSFCEDSYNQIKFEEAEIGIVECGYPLWNQDAPTVLSTLCTIPPDDTSGTVYVSYDCSGKEPHCFEVTSESHLENSVLLMSYNVPSPFEDAGDRLSSCSNYFLGSAFSSASVEEGLFYPTAKVWWNSSYSYPGSIHGSMFISTGLISSFHACASDGIQSACDSLYGCCNSGNMCTSYCEDPSSTRECEECQQECVQQCIDLLNQQRSKL